jgi:RNA polymerase sigma factor (sigma-70 family)
MEAATVPAEGESVNEERTSVMARVRKLVEAHRADQADDAQLLARFVGQKDETAFEALVRRYGPMVLRVCRRILGQIQDAEDAFQATFLVFTRKAAELRDISAVGPWLFGVASRVARKARVAGQRRATHEAQALTRTEVGDAPTASLAEAESLLDEQLALLPEAYRSVLVLCYVQGLTRDQVAQRLRLSLAGVKKRLERGRSLLRDRLARRGVQLSAGLFGALLAGDAMAAVPPALIATTTENALTLASGRALPHTRPTELYRGALRTMSLTRTTALAALAALAVGIAVIAGFGTRTVSAQLPEPQERVPTLVRAPVPAGAVPAPAKQGKTVPAGVPLDARLVGKKTTFPLDLHGMTADQFREKLKPAPVMPGQPQVDFQLEVTNTGDKALKLQVGGSANHLTLDLQGPGAVTVPGLVRRPGRPVVQPGRVVTVEPGKTVVLLDLPRLTFNSPKGLRLAYWVEAGDYTLDAEYQVTVAPAPAGTEANADGFGPVTLQTPRFKFTVEAPAEKK